MNRPVVYYITQRPPMPGAMPKDGLLQIIYCDKDGNRTYVPSIMKEAYARLVYGRELSAEEIFDYELVPQENNVRLSRQEVSILKALIIEKADNKDYDSNLLHDIYTKLLVAEEG